MKIPSAASPSTGGKLYLIDASPYIFRAYFALPASMTDSHGQPVQAIYGFAAFLLKLWAEEQPTHWAVTFDESLNTSFRNEFYPAYKAQRDLPPPELEAQQKGCRQVAEAFGARCFAHDRFEADDLIAGLWHGAAADSEELTSISVVSSDKDLAQLVDQRTELFDFAKGRRMDVAGVREKFGVRPDQVVDLLALAGDSVDNIPGVPGVGPKTASALLAHFEHLEDLLVNLEAVKDLPLRGAKGVAARLEEHRESAEISKRLAQLESSQPSGVSLADLEFQGADKQQVEELFERFGFGTLKDRIPHYRD